MTKPGANEIAADLNKNLLHNSPFEAKIIKPQRGNVRGSGYEVCVVKRDNANAIVVDPQRERRPLLELTRKALDAWNPHYRYGLRR